MKVIAVANQKGGVGKTTTSINLAAALGAAGKDVLLVDMDAQGNATMGVGVPKNGLTRTGCDVLLEEAEIREVIVERPELKLSLLPSNADMTAAEVGLRNQKNGELALRNALKKVNGRFDYVIVDCPPALSMLTVNALAAADGVLIPMQCEYYALEGLTALLDTIEKVRGVLNADLKLEGILRTMYDPRNNLSGQVSEQLTQHFRNQVYDAIIPRNVRLAEAPSHGLPVGQYDAACAGALAYEQLAKEMLRRHRG